MSRWITRDGLRMLVHGRTWKWWKHHRAMIEGRTPNRATTHKIKPTAPTRKPGHGLAGKQADLHKFMVATVGNPYGWHYAAVRPLSLPRRLTPAELASMVKLKTALAKIVKGYRSDCSWGVKTGHRVVGCKDDPTGANWADYGNSSSTYAHLRKRRGLDNAYHPDAADLAACEVGDVLLVGVNGSDHMAMIMEAGPDPLLWSDGHEGAPNSYRVSDDPRRPISVCIPKF